MRTRRLARNFGGFILQACAAGLQLLGPRPGGFESAARVGMLTVAGLDGRLQPVAFGLGLGLRPAQGDELAVGLGHLLLGTLQIGAQRLQPVFALDDAGMGILATADPDPALAHPLSGAGDDRLAGGQRAAQAQRVGQRLTGEHALELAGDRGRSPGDFRGQRLRAVGTGIRRALLDQRDAAAASFSSAASTSSRRSTQDGFEIVAEGGFDRAVPAVGHVQLLGHAVAGPPGRWPASHSPARGAL